MKRLSQPVATLYVYRRQGRAIAVAIGQYPPDPGVTYDSLQRIPIAANGSRPPWRAFTWHLREPMAKALARSRWPDEPVIAEVEDESQAATAILVGKTVIWHGERYRVLAIDASGLLFARNTQTKDAVRIDPREIT